MCSIRTIPTQRHDLIKNFFFKYKKHATSKTEIEFFKDIHLLNSFLNEIMPFASQYHLADSFAEATSQFSLEKESILTRYFKEELSLNQLCNAYACFIFEKKLLLLPDRVTKTFQKMNDFTNNTVNKVISDVILQKNINILGYGGANGEQERKIKKLLIEKGCQQVNLFLYDPYNSSTSEDLIYLSKKDILNNYHLKFDLVFSRWALHHVEEKDRWNDFVLCINKCKAQGCVLILEDGLRWPFMNTQEALLYRAVIGFLDTQVNASLRPAWFLETMPKIGQNFFIKYLNKNTFEYFEKSTSVKFKNKYIIPIGPYILPCQALCLFVAGDRDETI